MLRANPDEDVFQVMAEASPNAILIVDETGRIVLVNRRATALFGYEREELVGSPMELLVPDRFRAGHPAHRTGFQSHPEVRTLGGGRTLFARSKEGREIPVEIGLSPIETSAGRLVLASVLDIRQRTAAEEALALSLREVNHLKAALDHHAIVAVTDISGRITYVNERFCAVSKYSKEELLGQDHRILNSGHHSKEFFRELWTTIGNGRVWKGEIKNRAKDGSFYWVDATIVPVLDEAGKPIQYIAIRVDISDRKRAEAEVRSQAVELARSNKDLEQFAYVASHDLQEPLRAVAGCLQILERRCKDQLDDRGRELIGHAVDGARRMQSLIEGLLAFSRVGSRGAPFQPADAGKALEDALENLSALILETGATIHQEPMPVLKMDHQHLTVLFQNLIANALKFRGSKAPVIAVRGVRVSGGWEVSVQDNGIGIEPRHFERIFVLFQRLHTRSEYPGTGIGLAICKKIVERYGGRIEVESVPGEGSVFRCFFPDA